MSSTLNEMIGSTYGRLSVVGVEGKKLRCVCSCGNERLVDKYKLSSGHTQSCGCFGLERRTKHGKHKTEEYCVWEGMRQRCNNPNNVKYALYGGKGVNVCKEWDDFDVFISDMGMRPSKGYTLERIDGNKGYSKENCKWATYKEQAQNTTQNHRIEYNGEVKTITEWAAHMGWHPSVIFSRIRYGWAVEKILGTPKGKRAMNERLWIETYFNGV